MIPRFTAGDIEPHRLPPVCGVWAGFGGAAGLGFCGRVGHDAAPGPGIQDDLVDASKQPLHGFQIHTPARDIGRLLVLLIDLEEARVAVLLFPVEREERERRKLGHNLQVLSPES